MFLLLIFVLTTLALMVALWVVTMFLQGYYYTEPTPNIAWQAPAAGAAIGGFITLWCLFIVNSKDVKPGNLPYDTILRFSPKVDLADEPAKELWAVRKGSSEPVHYKLKKGVQAGQTSYRYHDVESGLPWSAGATVSIQIKSGNDTYRFLPRPPNTDLGYQEFADDTGWVMRVYSQDGPTGRPYSFRWGRFWGNLFLNFFHLALWFICFWLVLRFHPAHALMLSLVSWLIMTLAVLPLILEQAGNRAMGG